MTVKKVCNNYVLVKFDRKREEINQNFVTRPSGIIMGEMVVDKAKTKVTGEGAWAIIKGEVIDYAKGEEFFYQEDIEGLGDAGQLDYDTDCEIEKGDTIIFDYHGGLQAKEQGRLFFEDNVPYGFIRYSQIFCRIRNGEIAPVNGFVFIEPMVEKKKYFDYEKEEISETKGTVRYAGKPVRKFRYNVKHKYSEGIDTQQAPIINKGFKDFKCRLAKEGDVVLL